MVFEKKMVDSYVTQVIYKSEQWNEIMFCNTLDDEDIDIIQIVHCKDDVYIIEYMNLEEIDMQNATLQQEPVCAIAMEHVNKKDYKLLDINQPIKILGKRDRPKLIPTPKGVPPMGYPDMPMEISLDYNLERR